MVAHQEIINNSFGHAVIYKLTSPSGKIYIGQTVNFKDRYSVYRRRKNNSIGKKLYHALEKYQGIENFEIEILAKVIITESVLELRETLKELEIFYIAEYDSFNTGYNLTIGGEGALGRVLTKETKDKIGKANLGGHSVEDIKCVCGKCKKEFGLQPHLYNNRIKQSKTGNIYCSSKCGGGKQESFVTINCAYCDKEKTYPTWIYNKRIKEGKTGQIFCNTQCYRKYIKIATLALVVEP